MKVYLKGIFVPLGREGVRIDVRPSSQFQRLVIGEVQIDFIPGTYEIQASSIIDASEDLIEYLQDKGVPRNEDYESTMDKLLQSVKTITAYLKYFYGIYEIDEEVRLSRKYQWSKDGITYIDVPDRRPTAWRGTNIMYTLPDNLLSWFPGLVARGITPFFAFTHLHKAFAEVDTRQQWINATVSAELGIKEFLIQYDAHTQSLITYMPSPPLDILYDKVLKDYTSESSPYAKELSKGATLRNKLIHRSTEPSPEKKKTLIYVHKVQAAIFHLYTLLYKGDTFFDYLYSLSVERLERASKL